MGSYPTPDKLSLGFPHGSSGKESACSIGDPGSIPGSGRLPGEANGYPPQNSCRRIPWTEEPHRLQSVRLQKSWTRLSDYHFPTKYTRAYTHKSI